MVRGARQDARIDRHGVVNATRNRLPPSLRRRPMARGLVPVSQAPAENPGGSRRSATSLLGRHSTTSSVRGAQPRSGLVTDQGSQREAAGRVGEGAPAKS